MKRRSRVRDRLKARDLDLLEAGEHHDGGGLVFRVEAAGSRHWVQRLTIRGKRVNRGVGPYPMITLYMARDKALDMQRAAREGRDLVREARIEAAKCTTFKEAFADFFSAKGETLKNPKHRALWQSTMETYVFPTIGRMPIGDVTATDIIKILKPIWVEKAETGKRVLQRVKATFDHAITNGWRESDPCRGVIQSLGGTGHRDVEHHRALAYNEVPAFLRTLRTCNSNAITKLAFEFLVLTATRSKETRLADWAEIDVEGKRWLIPKERMKAKVEHVVPLSPRALEILRMAQGPGTWKARALEGRGLIFPSWPRGKPLSDMTLTKVLRDLGFADRATAHGFRTSFRTWCAETNQCRWEVAEAALAHAIKDKTEAAYRRTTYLEERTTLMLRWAAHCG
jgi:integrase